MAKASRINFFYEVSGFTLKDRGKLKSFLEKTFRKEGRPLESLNYIFVSDKRLLAINRDYLQHDYYTDIISFDLSAGDDLVGEIYISIDRVRENARALGHSFKSELHRVIFHGALHLCGYKDKSLRDIKLMRKKEEESLSAYFA